MIYYLSGDHPFLDHSFLDRTNSWDSYLIGGKETKEGLAYMAKFLTFWSFLIFLFQLFAPDDLLLLKLLSFDLHSFGFTISYADPGSPLTPFSCGKRFSKKERKEMICLNCLRFWSYDHSLIPRSFISDELLLKPAGLWSCEYFLGSSGWSRSWYFTFDSDLRIGNLWSLFRIQGSFIWDSST